MIHLLFAYISEQAGKAKKLAQKTRVFHRTLRTARKRFYTSYYSTKNLFYQEFQTVLLPLWFSKKQALHQLKKSSRMRLEFLPKTQRMVRNHRLSISADKLSQLKESFGEKNARLARYFQNQYVLTLQSLSSQLAKNKPVVRSQLQYRVNQTGKKASLYRQTIVKQLRRSLTKLDFLNNPAVSKALGYQLSASLVSTPSPPPITFLPLRSQIEKFRILAKTKTKYSTSIMKLHGITFSERKGKLLLTFSERKGKLVYTPGFLLLLINKRFNKSSKILGKFLGNSFNLAQDAKNKIGGSLSKGFKSARIQQSLKNLKKIPSKISLLRLLPFSSTHIESIPRLYSISEAAKFLGLSTDTLRNWDASGKLTAQRTKGGSRRYSLSQLKTFAQEQNPYLAQHFTSRVKTSSSPSPFKQNGAFKFFGISLLLLLIFLTGTFVLSANKTEEVRYRTPSQQSLVAQKTSGNEIESEEKVLAAQNSNFFGQFINFIFSPLKNVGLNLQQAIPLPKGNPDSLVFLRKDLTRIASSSADLAKRVTSLELLRSTLPRSTTYINLIGETIIDSGGNIYPADNNSPSLGSSTNAFYGLWLNKFVVDKDGNLSVGGNTTLGDESGDTITFNGRIASDIIASSNSEKTLGDSDHYFKTAYITTVNASTVNSSTLTVSSVLSLANGSAATPALNFSNSTGAGLYRIDSNSIGLITGGTAGQGITIDSSGNVGIGTTSPNFNLEITGTLHVSGATRLGNVSYTWPNGDGSNGQVLATNGSGVLAWSSAGSGSVGGSGTTNYLSLWTSSSALGNSSFYETGGNVGLGTITPGSAKLAIVGGSLGIGTTSPGQTLDIAGNLRLTGTTTFNQIAYTWPGSDGSNTQVLATNGSGVLSWTSVAGGVSGSGIANFIPIWSNSSTLSSSLLYQTGGNVGIGVTGPGARLSLFANNGGGLAVGDYNFATSTAPTNGLAVLGNVGIGTTSPGFNLTVAGTVYVTGSARFDSSVLHANGSATSPSITFTNDTDTGLFTSIANTLNLTTGGLERLRVDSNGNIGIGVTGPGARLSLFANNGGGVAIGDYNFATSTAPTNGLAVLGNVGIGTSSPNFKLEIAGTAHIIGATALDTTLTVGGTTTLQTLTTNSTLTFNNLSAQSGSQLCLTGSSVVGTCAAGSGISGQGTASFIPLFNSSTALTNSTLYQSAGNIGIGTSNPLARLTVAGTGTTTGLTFLTTDSLGTQRFAILDNGNVGIGTTAPLASLYDTGNAMIGFASGRSGNLASGLAVSGSIGIGTSDPGSAKLAIYGGNIGIGTSSPGASIAVVGNELIGYSGTQTAPANGLAVLGNVGIGTTSPNFKLEVAGTTHLTGATQLDSTLTVGGTTTLQTLTTNSTLTFNNLSAQSGSQLCLTGSSVVGTCAAGSGISGQGTASFIPLFNSSTALTNSTLYQSAGNIGIGTSNPLARLTVAGTGTTTGLTFLTTDSLGTQRFAILDNGNVGIGTTAPSALLNIAGTSTNSFTFAAATGTITQVSTASGGGGVGYSLSANSINSGSSLSITSNALTTGQGLNITSSATGNNFTGSLINATLTGNNVNNTGSIYKASITGTSSAAIGLLISNSGTGASIGIFSGNVGLGTTAPNTALDVIGNGTYAGDFMSGNIGIGTSTPSGLFQVASSTGNPGLTVLSGGNVGIGSSSPGFNLTVAGTVYVTGSARFDSSVLHANGSATSPSITFTNDTDTGLFTSIANTLNLTTGGLERLRVDSNGNIGIGVTGPGGRLSIFTNNSGGVAIGDYNFATSTAPTNGLAVLGNVGIGTTSPGAKLTVAGGGQFNCTANFTNTTGKTSCSDVAEVYTTDEELEKGDVLKITNENRVGKTTKQYEGTLVGVYSTSPGILVGNGAQIGSDSQEPSLPKGQVPVALSGRVPTKVSLENGPIAVGDYLTSSSIPGVAMKAIKAGQIVGKALEGFSGNSTCSTSSTAPCIGKILVFVSVGFADPTDILSKLVLDSGGNLIVQSNPVLGTNTTSQTEPTAVASPSAQPVTDNTFTNLSAQIKDLVARVDLLQSIVASPSSIPLATESASLNLEASSSAQLELKNLDLENATISGNLTVLGKTLLSDIGITGNIITGLLSIHGLEGEIGTLSGPLKLQSAGIDGVELVGGKVTIDIHGVLTVQKLAVAKKTLDSATLSAGQLAVTISSDEVTENSKIFVTAKTPTGKQELFISNKTPGTSFTVSVEEPYKNDIEFDWWIIN